MQARASSSWFWIQWGTRRGSPATSRICHGSSYTNAHKQRPVIPELRTGRPSSWVSAGSMSKAYQTWPSWGDWKRYRSHRSTQSSAWRHYSPGRLRRRLQYEVSSAPSWSKGRWLSWLAGRLALSYHSTVWLIYCRATWRWTISEYHSSSARSGS